MKQQMVYNYIINYFVLLTQFYCSFLLTQFYHQLFLHILQLIKLLFSCIHTYNYQDSNQIYCHYIFYLLHTHICIYFLLHFCLLLQIIGSNLHTHLQLSRHFICFVFFVHDIKSNTFTVIFLITSGIHTIEYGLLTLLQFPLHLHCTKSFRMVKIPENTRKDDIFVDFLTFP